MLVLDDCRVKIRELIRMVVTNERVFNTLYEHFGMKKLSTRWLQHLLM